MKKIALLFVACILQCHFIFGKPIPMQGYFIDNNDVSSPITLMVDLGILSKDIPHLSMQGNVKYTDKLGKKGKLKAKEVKEYGFEYEGRHYRYLSVASSWNPVFKNQLVFLRLETDGPCQLFTYYETSTTNNLTYERSVFKKGSEDCYMVTIVSRLAYGKTLSEYFSDCEVVSKKIKDGILKNSNCQPIAEAYNANCGK